MPVTDSKNYRPNLTLSSLARAVRTALGRPLPWSALAVALPGLAAAGPSGEQAAAGAATVSRPDSNNTVIDQGSARAIINWQTFSVGGQEHVIFNQPNAAAIALNRVVGQNPSSILGSLSANGRVFLVNPRGVYFGPTATVDVGGLVASVMDISNEDFLAGNYVFSRSPDSPDGASVINEGVITARDHGFVVLAGDYVSNSGVITARLGTVALAAGSAMTLDVNGDGLVSFAVDEAAVTDLAGVSNTGEVYADGGRVIMTAKVAADLVSTAVNSEGLVQARSLVESNGEIYLSASGGDVSHTGTLDVSGEAGTDGGTARVRSDQDIVLASGSEIRAGGDGTGNGGNVSVVAEEGLAFEDAAVIDATGGEEAGTGGFVELSGHQAILLAGDLDIGAGGALVIDPNQVDIVNGNNNNFGSAPQEVSEQFLEGLLQAGTNVSIIAATKIKVRSLTDDGEINGQSGYGGDLFLGIGSATGSDETGGYGGVFSAPIFTLSTTGGTIEFEDLSNKILLDGDFAAVTGQSGGVGLGIIDIGHVTSLETIVLGGTFPFDTVKAGTISAGDLRAENVNFATATALAENDITINSIAAVASGTDVTADVRVVSQSGDIDLGSVEVRVASIGGTENNANLDLIAMNGSVDVDAIEVEAYYTGISSNVDTDADVHIDAEAVNVANVTVEAETLIQGSGYGGFFDVRADADLDIDGGDEEDAATIVLGNAVVYAEVVFVNSGQSIHLDADADADIDLDAVSVTADSLTVTTKIHVENSGGTFRDFDLDPDSRLDIGRDVDAESVVLGNTTVSATTVADVEMSGDGGYGGYGGSLRPDSDIDIFGDFVDLGDFEVSAKVDADVVSGGYGGYGGYGGSPFFDGNADADIEVFAQDLVTGKITVDTEILIASSGSDGLELSGRAESALDLLPNDNFAPATITVYDPVVSANVEIAADPTDSADAFAEALASFGDSIDGGEGINQAKVILNDPTLVSATTSITGTDLTTEDGRAEMLVLAGRSASPAIEINGDIEVFGPGAHIDILSVDPDGGEIDINADITVESTGEGYGGSQPDSVIVDAGAGGINQAAISTISDSSPSGGLVSFRGEGDIILNGTVIAGDGVPGNIDVHLDGNANSATGNGILRADQVSFIGTGDNDVNLATDAAELSFIGLDDVTVNSLATLPPDFDFDGSFGDVVVSFAGAGRGPLGGQFDNLNILSQGNLDVRDSDFDVSGTTNWFSAAGGVDMRGVNVTTDTLIVIAAGDVQMADAELDANALLMNGQNIFNGPTTLHVGGGSVPGISGDPVLIDLLENTLGVPVASRVPDITFIARDVLDLSETTVDGASYIWLQGNRISTFAQVIPASPLIIQHLPFTLTNDLVVTAAAGTQLPNTPETTLVFGAGADAFGNTANFQRGNFLIPGPFSGGNRNWIFISGGDVFGPSGSVDPETLIASSAVVFFLDLLPGTDFETVTTEDDINVTGDGSQIGADGIVGLCQ